MSGRPYGGGNYQAVYLPHWYYLNQTSIAGNDASQAVALPNGTQVVEIRPEGGAVYFAINADFAQANSGGYIPEDGAEIIGPLANLNSLHVFAATGVTVHILFFRENAEEQ